MDSLSTELLGPDLISRVCGGFLAISRRSVAIRLGAIGATEADARAAFNVLVQQWQDARNMELAQKPAH
jgi:hypothetical protein